MYHCLKGATLRGRDGGRPVVGIFTAREVEVKSDMYYNEARPRERSDRGRFLLIRQKIIFIPGCVQGCIILPGCVQGFII